MCETLFKMIEFQDVSRDVVLSRASSTASLLSDLSQISDKALVACSAALTQTVTEHASYLSTDNDATVISNALSNILAAGGRLKGFPDILSAVSQSIQALSAASQLAMVVGEPMKQITTSTCRIGTLKFDSTNASTLSLPQLQEEIFNGKPATLVDINSSFSDGSIGVSLVQYSKNPRALVATTLASTSTGVGISLTSYSVSGENRKLSSGSGVSATITLRNIHPMMYSNITAEVGMVTCKETKGTGSYLESAVCKKSGETFSFLCPDMSKGGSYYFSCPTKYDGPVCTFWNEDESTYTVNPNCKVISATSDTTRCSCSMESQYVRKLLNETVTYSPTADSPESWLAHTSHRYLQQAEVTEFTSSVQSVATNFGKTFESLGLLVIDDVQHNQTILIALSTVLGTLLLGVIFFVSLDVKEHKAESTKGWKKKPKIIYSVNEFFDSVIPEEFSGISWIKRLTSKILTEHDWFTLILPYNPERQYRTVKWITAIGRIINILFIDTVLAFLFFADDGTCQLQTSDSMCLSIKALDLSDLCSWDPDVEHCSFQGSSNDFLSTMLLTTVITTITIPLDKFVTILVMNCKNFFVQAHGHLLKVQSSLLGDLNGPDFRSLPHELNDIQRKTPTTNLLRAARLVKMQKSMDKVNSSKEVQMLLSRPTNIWDLPPVKTTWQGFKKFHIFSLSMRDTYDTDSASHILRYGKSYLQEDLLKSKILSARRQALKLKKGLNELDNMRARDVFLLQHFIVNCLKGFKRQLAYRYFFSEFESAEDSSAMNYKRYASLILLPTYFIFVCLYIFLFGVRIGSKATETWLLGSLSSGF